MNKRILSDEEANRPPLPEERLLALVKATSDVVYRMSPDWKTMTELCGKGFLADTEEPNENWLDKYIHPDDQPFVTGVIGECIREKRTFELEHRVLREDGGVGWTYSRAIPLLDGNGGIREWFGAASDITAHKRAEEALRESEAKYRSLFDSIDEGFCIAKVLFDEHDRPLDYRFLEVNRSFERQTGLADAAGRCMRDMVPNHEQHWFDIYGRVALTGEPVRFQNPAGALGRVYDVYAFRVGKPEQRRVAILFNDITERKRVEEALRDSELRHTRELEAANRQKEDILESISDCFYALDKDLCFIYANKAAEEIWGLSRADLIGRKIEDVFPSLIDISMAKFRQALDEQNPQHYEVFSGVIGRWGDMSVCPARDGISVFFRDTTERKRAEEKIRKSEERQEYLLKLSDALRPLSDTVEIKQAASRVVGEFLEVDRAFYCEITEDGNMFYIEDNYVRGDFPKVTGYFQIGSFGAAMDVLRRGEALIIDDQNTTLLKTPLERQASTELQVLASMTVPLIKEGSWVANFGVCHGVPRNWTEVEIAILQETAERTWAAVERARAERALRESEGKYRELVKHAPTGIYELDFRSNRFVSVNDVMCELTGYSREEFQGMSPFDFLDTEGKKLFRNRMDEWLSGKKPGPHADYKVLTKDGREIYIFLNVSFTKDENGEPSGAMVIAHDVTMRRKMEEALRRSEEELRNADKSKNTFISVLSHELRNPLAAIAAGISILEISDNRLQTEKAKEIMKRQIVQLCKLVDDLLETTRIAQNKIQLKKENIDLKDLVINAAKDIASAFEKKGVQFSIEVQEKPILIYADPVRITQSIGNLLYNALKFTPEGGTVSLSLRRETGEAVITVRDNGIGISQEILPHLFKPFTQADNSLDRQNNGGLGLGLSIVKGIIEMHEGTVTASSEGLGKGSLFTTRLPVIMDRIEAQDNNQADLDTRIYKVLVIEDNRDLAELSCALLNMLGHEAFAAYDGIAGISKAKEIRPDIILCDIGLPGKNGYEVAKMIKADDGLNKALLVALTGYADEASIKRTQESGFDKHMAKPVSLAALQQVFNEHW